MRKRLVMIFLKVANRQIIRARAGKRLLALKKLIGDNKIANRETMKKFVLEDWKNSLNVRQESTDDQDNIECISF